MNRYESYKETGVQWIGEIPRHWGISRLKFLSNKLRSGGTPKADNSNFYTDESGTPWVAIADMSTVDFVKETEKHLTEAGLKDKNLQIYPAGTLLYSIYATLGKVAELSIPAAINQAILAISLKKKYLQSFCKYVLKAQEKFVIGLASTNTQANLNAEKVSNYYMPVPPLEEQKAIADFLDAKTAELDEEKQNLLKQIELLKELKLSTISNNVVSGLNKDVTFVDSKVNEIGFIPKHWSCVRIKRKVRVIRGGSPRPIEAYLTKGNGYNWIKIGDAIKGSKYITHTEQKIKEDGLKSTRLVSKGDLILSNSMSFGQPYILNIDGCIHDGWVAFSHFNGVNKEYLFYTLLSKSLKSQFEKTVDGSVVSNLNIDKIGMSFIPLPPLNEQEEIASYLDVKATEIDEQIQLQEQQIKLIDELKQSIISRAVTGKIKVF